MPPGTGKVPAAPESGEPEQDKKDRCEDYYTKPNGVIPFRGTLRRE